jgi:hypothetical protein
MIVVFSLSENEEKLSRSEKMQDFDYRNVKFRVSVGVKRDKI